MKIIDNRLSPTVELGKIKLEQEFTCRGMLCRRAELVGFPQVVQFSHDRCIIVNIETGRVFWEPKETLVLPVSIKVEIDHDSN
jgi:hypothetical protein